VRTLFVINSETITVDGVEYALADYPQAYIEKMDEILLIDLNMHLVGWGYTPDTCPADIIALHDGLHLLNGVTSVTAPVEHQWHTVGTTLDHIDLDEYGQWSVFEVEADKGGAMAIMNAYAWADVFAKADWYVAFSQVENEPYYFEASFGFGDADDEIGFLAEMTRFFANEGARA